MMSVHRIKEKLLMSYREEKERGFYLGLLNSFSVIDTSASNDGL